MARALGPAKGDQMSFWHLVRVVRTRLWMILGLVAITPIVIILAAPKPRVVYTASTYMSPTEQVMAGGVGTASGGDQNNRPDRAVVLSNLIILAEGGEVYQRALDFLAKPVEEQRAEAPGLPIYKQIPRVETKPGHLVTYQDWGDVVEFAPVYNPSIGENGTTTDIIRITAKLENGEDAPYIANAVGHAFAMAFLDKSREENRKYARFLQSSKEEAQAKLRDLQNQIAQYKQAHNVVAVDAETQNAVASLSSLEAGKSAAEAAAREAEAALRDINAQLAVQPLVTKDELPADMNPNVQKLRQELDQAEADLRMIAQRYTPAHETYKAAQARIDMLKERIAKEGSTYNPPTLNQIHADLLKKRSEAQYNLASARAKLASVSGSLAQAQSKVNSLAQAEPQLADLMREYSQAESTYKLFSEKAAQVQIAEEEFTKTGSIQPYGWASAATGPIVEGPSRRTLLIYGFVLSLIIGIAVAVWLDSIDTRMRNAADVEKLLELPVMGLTPRLTGRDGTLPKLTHMYPLSAMAESYRILRTNILFELRDNPFKTLMVATGRPGQGATTTICNLAIALAQIGKKIILIDADMRRPSLHNFFGVPNEAGLSTLLQGQGNLTDAFQQTEIENLIVIPAGPQPLNPSELLGSERMQELVKRLEEHCDLVLFDTPSTVVFSDGPMLASWIDAVLMVVSANQAPRGTEAQTRDLLRRARANLIGVVVNRMAPEAVDSCYYYAHYYSGSVPQQAAADALESGSGRNGGGEHPDNRVEPRAMPAPSRQDPAPAGAAVGDQPAAEDEENPFPD